MCVCVCVCVGWAGMKEKKGVIFSAKIRRHLFLTYKITSGLRVASFS